VTGMAKGERGNLLSTAALLFGVLAVSNFLKPLQLGGARTGFVLFGERLTGMPNAIVGPLFGAYLAVYAVGIWRMKRWALPMAWAYAGYVLVNLLLFRFRTPQVPGQSAGPVFGIVYLIVALGTSWGTAFALRARAAELD
jgi:hypothetical protein